MRTDALDGLQHDVAARGIQVVRRLIHAFLEGGTCEMLFHDRCPRRIVPTVNGASSKAVQAAAIASKGDQRDAP
jgi:hypothetical protein